MPQHPSPHLAPSQSNDNIETGMVCSGTGLYQAGFPRCFTCLIIRIFKTPSEVDVIIIPFPDGETEAQEGGELTQGHRAELKDPGIKPQKSGSCAYYSFES